MNDFLGEVYTKDVVHTFEEHEVVVALRTKLHELKSSFFTSRWAKKKLFRFADSLNIQDRASFIKYCIRLLRHCIQFEVIKGKDHKVLLKALEERKAETRSPLQRRVYGIKLPTSNPAALIEAFRKLKEDKVINIGNRNLGKFIFQNFETGYSENYLMDIFRKHLDISKKYSKINP